jgi:hypothetical protein
MIMRQCGQTATRLKKSVFDVIGRKGDSDEVFSVVERG